MAQLCYWLDTDKIVNTLAVDGDTPRPVWLFTANALAIHDVIVSGMVVLIVTFPSTLKVKTIRNIYKKNGNRTQIVFVLNLVQSFEDKIKSVYR